MGEATAPVVDARRDPSLAALLPWLTLLLALGVFLRAPVSALPLEGDDAALATRGGRMGAEEAFALEGVADRGPLLPMLLAPVTASGATPTGALRWLGLLLGAAIAPLGLLLGLRLGLTRRAAQGAALLLAVHPVLAAAAGGAHVGNGTLAAVLLLLAVLGGERRSGLLPLLLLPLADPCCAVYVPALLTTHLRREHTTSARIVLLLLALLALLLAPLPSLPFSGAPGAALLAFLGQWLPAASLVVLIPFLPRGARRLARRSPALGIGAALHLLLLLFLAPDPGIAWGWAGVSAGQALVPFLVVTGVAGVEGTTAVRRQRTMRVAAGLGLAASLFLVIGPLQTLFLPHATPPAGRLSRLGRVVRAAADVAGPDGWVAIDPAVDLSPYEALRLADLAGGVPVGRLPRGGEAAEDGDGLGPLPDEAFAGPLGVLTRQRPVVLGVVTLGGRGIYRQEPVVRVGPWLVLRITPP